MTNEQTEGPVFLSGATGFVGQRLYPRLARAGVAMRCGTRSVERARNKHPRRDWVEFDVERPDTMHAALEGCDSAYFLVHQMAAGPGYREREQQAAHEFARAAKRAGLRRVVYLGGVEPASEPSEHLASRLQTGWILRDSGVSTVELRASMIIGAGSASWQVVRDLAARLPVMILPAWTQSRTEPVYIDDVVEALLAALWLDENGSVWCDIPGPEVLTVEQILRRTARILGHDIRPLHVPLLSPKVSSYWLRLITGADYNVAHELVAGLSCDLLAHDDSFWERIGHTERVGFDDAVARTLHQTAPDSALARTYEGLVGRVWGRPQR